jgi:hypothetical protein
LNPGQPGMVQTRPEFVRFFKSSHDFLVYSNFAFGGFAAVLFFAFARLPSKTTVKTTIWKTFMI